MQKPEENNLNKEGPCKKAGVGASIGLLILGAIVMLFPSFSASLLPLTIGVGVLIYGVFELCLTFAGQGQTALGLPRPVLGVIFIAVALVMIFNRTLSLVYIAVVFGMWSLVSGVMRIRAAFISVEKGRERNFGCIDGVLRLLLGGLVLIQPFASAVAWSFVLGVFLLCAGVSTLITSLWFRKLTQNTPYL